MSARFITGILVAAATITAMAAAPAKADQNNELSQFLGAAAGIYVTGRILNEFADRQSLETQVHGQNGQNRHRQNANGHNRNGQNWGNGNGNGNANGNGYRDRRGGNGGWNHQARKPALPSRCMVRVDRKRTTFALPRRCLRRNYVGFHRLPDQCLMKIRGRGNHNGYGQSQPRRAYALRCLRHKGYRVARY